MAVKQQRNEYFNEYGRTHRVRYSLSLSKEKDADIITELNNVSGMSKQSYIKMLIRKAMRK